MVFAGGVERGARFSRDLKIKAITVLYSMIKLRYARRHAAVNLQVTQSAAAMASTFPQFFSRRVCQSSPLSRFSQSIPRNSPSIRNLSARRSYASGPNPTPGKNPLTIWPFLAITLVGSGAYALMVKSRAGMYHLLSSENFMNDWRAS